MHHVEWFLRIELGVKGLGEVSLPQLGAMRKHHSLTYTQPISPISRHRDCSNALTSRPLPYPYLPAYMVSQVRVHQDSQSRAYWTTMFHFRMSRPIGDGALHSRIEGPWALQANHTRCCSSVSHKPKAAVRRRQWTEQTMTECGSAAALRRCPSSSFSSLYR